MLNEKYIVFKRDNWEEWKLSPEYLDEVEDAVVIRRQDIFAPPAFDAYANSIRIVCEGLGDQVTRELKNIADYFHEQAVIAWGTNRKLPD